MKAEANAKAKADANANANAKPYANLMLILMLTLTNPKLRQRSPSFYPPPSPHVPPLDIPEDGRKIAAGNSSTTPILGLILMQTQMLMLRAMLMLNHMLTQIPIQTRLLIPRSVNTRPPPPTSQLGCTTVL